MLRGVLAQIDPRGRLGRRAYWLSMLAAWALIAAAGLAELLLDGQVRAMPLLAFLWITPWAAIRTMRRLRDAGGWPWLVPIFWLCVPLTLFVGWAWAMVAAGGLEPGPVLPNAARGLALVSALLAGVIVARALRRSCLPTRQKKGAAAEAPRPSLSTA